jgi:hypothetical protein
MSQLVWAAMCQAAPHSLGQAPTNICVLVSSPPTHWEVEWAPVAGVIAAVITLGIVLWQSISTRRAAEAAERQANETQDYVVLTNNLLVENARARFDARASFLRVTASLGAAYVDGAMVSGGQSLGTDSAMLLELKFSGMVRNEGSSTVSVDLDVTMSWDYFLDLGRRIGPGQIMREERNDNEELGGQHLLEPGCQISVRGSVVRSLGEWADAKDPRTRLGLITYSDDFDSGIIDTWTFALDRVPVRTSSDGDFVLVDDVRLARPTILASILFPNGHLRICPK